MLNERGSDSSGPLAAVSHVSMHFDLGSSVLDRLRGRLGRGMIRAVDGVTLAIRKGEVVALVGESGSGKTTLARCLAGLLRPTDGAVRFRDVRIDQLSKRRLAGIRKSIQFVSQDPHGSLSPRMRVSHLFREAYSIHHIPEAERQRPQEILEEVGMRGDQADKYPHQLSGGQARRVGIARALTLRPELLILDEPTAGLDASSAAGVLNLLMDLRDRFHLSYLIITHDLQVAGYMADTIAVMYLGQLAEIGPAEDVLSCARHPYTQGLLSVSHVEEAVSGSGRSRGVGGEIPSPRNPPSGCRFRTRCPFARDTCTNSAPRFELVSDAHYVACHYWKEIADGRLRPQGQQRRSTSLAPGLSGGGDNSV